MFLIGLDEEKIAKDGYIPQSMWDWVDEVFFEFNFSKEPQPDGTVLYACSPDSDNHLSDIGCVFCTLVDDKNFGKYCNKWIEYDNDFDESQPFEEVDFLENARKDYPTFQQGQKMEKRKTLKAINFDLDFISFFD